MMIPKLLVRKKPLIFIGVGLCIVWVCMKRQDSETGNIPVEVTTVPAAIRKTLLKNTNLTEKQDNTGDKTEITTTRNSHTATGYLNQRQDRVISPHDFKYIINPNDVCEDTDVFLVVYVHSSPDHFYHRGVIRQTWGNPKYYNDVIVRVLFILGKTNNSTQNAVLKESQQHHDIVQEDFVDSYRNLTHKARAGLKWLSHHCRQAKFVLKSDDDMFVNMFSLIAHLQMREEVGTRAFIMCFLWQKARNVKRDGKWGVSETEYEKETYPPYCSGSAFAMSMDTALALHNISYYVPFLWVDDIYVTGVLPEKLESITFIGMHSSYEFDGLKLEETFNSTNWMATLFCHTRDNRHNGKVWNNLEELAKRS